MIRLLKIQTIWRIVLKTISVNLYFSFWKWFSFVFKVPKHYVLTSMLQSVLRNFLCNIQNFKFQFLKLRLQEAFVNKELAPVRKRQYNNIPKYIINEFPTKCKMDIEHPVWFHSFIFTKEMKWGKKTPERASSSQM